MSPSFVNDNSHPIRVDDENGKAQRIRPGAVVSADGAYADRLSSTAGVREASADDQRSFDDAEAARRGTAPGEGNSARMAAKLALGPARVALRSASVAAPLQRVIGDDQAPYGPGTGVVTTKGAVVDGLPVGHPDREAFAQGEAREFVEGAGTPAPMLPRSAIVTSPEVHNAQAAATQQAEEVASEIADGAQGIVQEAFGPGESGEGEPGGADSGFKRADNSAQANPNSGGNDGDDELPKGKALDEALKDANLSTSGTAAEKRERLKASWG